MSHRASEEDLRLDELSVAHRDELCVAVTPSGLQLVLVEDEHAAVARADEFEDVLGRETVGGGKQRWRNAALSMWSSCGLVNTKFSAMSCAAVSWS